MHMVRPLGKAPQCGMQILAEVTVTIKDGQKINLSFVVH